MDVSQSMKAEFLSSCESTVGNRGPRLGRSATVEASSPLQKRKKKNCTLPAQALPCSGSKGLSQPGPG